MQVTELSAKECRQILTRVSMGRLGCSRDDQPYVVPIYFAYEPDHLYGFATGGQKMEWMRTNPKVCVEVDEIASQFGWVSLVVTGRFRELPDAPPHAQERKHARELLEQRSLWWETAFATRRVKSASDAIPPLFYSIQIESISGYRAVANADEAATTNAALPLSTVN